MSKPAEQDRHCAGGQKLIKPCLSASEEHRETVAAGLLPRLSVPLQWPAFRPRSSQRGRALSYLLMVVAMQTHPKAHSSPGRAVGAKRHLGQRASGFIDCHRSSDGLFESTPLVPSLAEPLFLTSLCACCCLLGALWVLWLCWRQPWPQQQLRSPARGLLTGSVPSRPHRDVMALHSMRAFHSSFIYRRRCRKREAEQFWRPQASGWLLRHSSIPWCLFLFNILPFCVYFAGVYFGKGSVYISVFTWSAHMVIFALPGLSIPPPPLPRSPHSSLAAGYSQQVKGSFCFQSGLPHSSPQPSHAGSSDKAHSCWEVF